MPKFKNAIKFYDVKKEFYYDDFNQWDWVLYLF